MSGVYKGLVGPYSEIVKPCLPDRSVAGWYGFSESPQELDWPSHLLSLLKREW